MAKPKPVNDTIRLSAFGVAESIQIKSFRASYTATLLSESSGELFYRVGEKQFLYIFNYGVVVFCDHSDIEMTETLNLISGYCQSPFQQKIRDDHTILTSDEGSIHREFDAFYVPEINRDVIKSAMFNLAQSVALDYYLQASENLLNEVRRFTGELEKQGRLSIGRKSMLRFIGRALNIKNRIAENLYIFDSPETVWDDQYLEKIHTSLVRFFDLRVRFREIEYTFKIIDDNLSVFRELLLHRESKILEWIIIGLILFEVMDLIVTKLV